MRLLVVTQKVDKEDSILGFFHRWIEEFSKNYESIVVICLEKGEYNLPPNVKVLSLGKERRDTVMIYHISVWKLIYIVQFYKYIWSERKNYDAVFVHMNQEYVLLGWKFWKLWGKKIYMWRNHAYGNIWTRLAVFVADKVFYTSPQSFTARFKKSVQMPVGIDTDFFKPNPNVERVPNSILFLGRIAPVKKVLEFIDWVKDRDLSVVTVAGSALPKDFEYEKKVRERVHEYRLDDKVKFVGAVTQEEARSLYQSHETYVNFTPVGSFDKTILEALACGCKLKVDNPDLKDLESMNPEELRRFVVENHSLEKLVQKLKENNG